MPRQTEQSVEPSPAPPARRPRNRSERQVAESVELKATIVRAAARVFAERGYTSTTLDAVAKLVGLTRPGILHHFSSKEALFLAVLEQEKTWAHNQMDVPPRTGTLAPIRELSVFVGGTEQARISLRLVHVLEGEGLADNEAAAAYVTERLTYVHGEVVRRLERCRGRGEVPDGTDLDELATLIVATINGLQKVWLVMPERDPRPTFDMFVDTLAARLS